MTDVTTSTAPEQERISRTDPYADIDRDLTLLAMLAPGEERARLRTDALRRCVPLAQHIARCYCGRGENFEDLYRVAFLGMVDAVDRFDPARDSPFLCFAVQIITGEIRRYLRGRGWARVPQRLEEIRLRLGPAVDALYLRLSRMPTASEIADELDVDFAEVTQVMITTRFAAPRRKDPR